MSRARLAQSHRPSGWAAKQRTRGGVAVGPWLGRLTLWGRRLSLVVRTYSARLWVSLTQGPSLQSSSPRSSVKMAGAFLIWTCRKLTLFARSHFNPQARISLVSTDDRVVSLYDLFERRTLAFTTEFSYLEHVSGEELLELN